MDLSYRIFPTVFGPAAIVASPRGLRRVYLPEAGADELRTRIDRDFPHAAEDPHLLPDVVAALQRYYTGEPVDFAVRYDWAGAGTFEIDVWRACAEIPYGETRTYGDLAERVGRPGGARAVGMAMSHNPFPIIVPCHRVCRTDGGLGGYSGPGGTDFKRKLLDMEAAAHTAAT